MKLTPIIGLSILAFCMMILVVFGISVFGSLDTAAPINNTSIYSDQYNATTDISISSITLLSFMPLILSALVLIVAVVLVVYSITHKSR